MLLFLSGVASNRMALAESGFSWLRHPVIRSRSLRATYLQMVIIKKMTGKLCIFTDERNTSNHYKMKFFWDENKNTINKNKHGISFETAKLVFEDPLHISIQDRHENAEERWQTLGVINGVTVLLVAHGVYEKNNIEIIRLISARKATKHERSCYEKAH